MEINIEIMKEHCLVLLLSVIFLIGSGFVVATGSDDPVLHGHDVGEIDWSKTIPLIRTNQICISGTCRTVWPSATDTRCDVAGRCSHVCIYSDCRTGWPFMLPVPPTCSGENVPRWTGSAWTCSLVNINGPLYYQCPSLTNNCVQSYPCKGQRSAIPYCNGQRQAFTDFCTGCGCYVSVSHSCRPVYT
ncbi:MAG: hypothetical protein JXC85_01300 [Candidatus Aenigmarchaeota archaeon]|nr:hypothetical protein [Candidatus Aenigmarchaeota archaeon]